MHTLTGVRWPHSPRHSFSSATLHSLPLLSCVDTTRVARTRARLQRCSATCVCSDTISLVHTHTPLIVASPLVAAALLRCDIAPSLLPLVARRAAHTRHSLRRRVEPPSLLRAALSAASASDLSWSSSTPVPSVDSVTLPLSRLLRPPTTAAAHNTCVRESSPLSTARTIMLHGRWLTVPVFLESQSHSLASPLSRPDSPASDRCTRLDSAHTLEFLSGSDVASPHAIMVSWCTLVPHMFSSSFLALVFLFPLGSDAAVRVASPIFFLASLTLPSSQSHFRGGWPDPTLSR
jgi:hypothetical protein